MKINRKRNFKLSEWEPASGMLDTDHIGPEETEKRISEISSLEIHNEFFNSATKSYAKHKQCSILISLLQQTYRIQGLESQIGEPWVREYKDKSPFLIDGLLYHKEKHTSALTLIDRDHVSPILQKCHDFPYNGNMSEYRTKERIESKAWWAFWEQEFIQYINTH
ncbi:hypothetical protein O181_037666 [Austropuccinia psidii MF-1]|uniref:Uncharacterized protein n=1 Tax=Austropuccinia psidii MF-1 TaxID=1389203 RepID=A0A9Q3HAZ9_9BASI|nr:hypothetical protein [Austropuccinia psidii MF-1]